MLTVHEREKMVLCSTSSSLHKVEITGEKLEPPFSRICSGNDNFITQILLSFWNKYNLPSDSGEAIPGTNQMSALSWVAYTCSIWTSVQSVLKCSSRGVFKDISFKAKNFLTPLDFWDDGTIFHVWVSKGSSLYAPGVTHQGIIDKSPPGF